MLGYIHRTTSHFHHSAPVWESSALSPVGSLSGAQQQLGGWAQCALAPRAAYCLVRVRAGGRAAPGGEFGLYASAEELLRVSSFVCFEDTTQRYQSSPSFKSPKLGTRSYD